MDTKLVGNKYKHFKGSFYKILHIATHTELGEKLVIYQNIKSPDKIWARPYSMFFDYVVKEDYNGPRFKLVN